MIIPTYTEDEILNELIEDFKFIKRKTKKIADSYLNKVRKSGGMIRETDYKPYSITTPSKNKWHVEIEFDQTKKIPWLFRACCIVEGDKKTKDYYLVRGLNTDSPYFVKVSSHALKRVRERNPFSKPESLPLDLLACWVFEHRETGICLRYMELKYLEILRKMNDLENIDDNSYIVLVNRGVYYATKTPKGNFVFKTYISTMMGITEVLKSIQNKMSKWSTEGELLSNMILVHQYYNKWLYDKEVLDGMLYTIIDKEADLELAENSPLILLKN